MTKDEIDRLKGALRIEEVAGRYVELKRKGRLWTGLCPFHADRHPSLTINPEKQTFVCYACGEKGDVLAFVRKIEHCSFSEAVGKLVENGKLKMKNDSHPKPNEGVSSHAIPLGEREQETPFLDRFQFSTFNFQFLKLLFPCASGHSELTPAWLDFEVGQAPCLVPPEWRAMRGRIIFPIRDESGELVAFAARRLSDSEADKESPKYINSAASALYRKSELLYGLYRAKEAIRREGFVFVTEGYKDVLAMHAAGFTHTVALCGTALCAGHIALLKKYTTEVYLLLDGDKAGMAAAARAAAGLREAGMDVAVCRLPEGEDPDSLFRRLGKAAFQAQLDALRLEVAPSAEVVLIRRIRRGMGLLSTLSDPVKRSPLLALLHTCIARLTKLSHQAGRPATMDWRWI